MGIALVETTGRPVTLILTVRDEAGTIVRGPKEIALGGHEQLAQFPNQDRFALGLPDSFNGSLWVEVKEEDGAVALTLIRQSPGVLTTFPAISLEHPITPVG